MADPPAARERPATKLRGQLRSQMKLGNEGESGAQALA
jgi:hypothetical protein